jgi:hypothetical protein
MIQAVTLADVKRVAKRLFDPARLTVVIGGSPAEGRSARPQRPLPPGSPPMPATGQTAASQAGGPAARAPGVTPPLKPVDKPVENPATVSPATPKSSGEAAKKP